MSISVQSGVLWSISEHPRSTGSYHQILPCIECFKLSNRMGGNAKDKICEECPNECLINSKRWANHCSQIHNKDSNLVKFRYYDK